jgi:two-component system CheB/CheR fusion protein
VGIGASAGGLEAFTELLSNLPEDSGAAFVLVQHLDPTHESILPELLARRTRMEVHQVENNTRVRPNQVYVIPPNAKMTISKGILKLLPRHEERGPRHCIDTFLHSLAEDQTERAIGVILSGSAFDGSSGLEAIKNEGGITFAQDASAKYDSMPRSAIATGCVDFVLPPAKIAEEISRIARHVPPAGLAAPEAEHTIQADPSYKKVLQALRARMGVDFSLYRPNTIKRRIARRMALHKLSDLARYATYLRNHGDEITALYQDVLISVTSFFRNPDAFETLKRKVFPRLIKNRTPDDPLRAWVLGCSTGQEAYSVAMAYLEFASRASTQVPLQIFATDLNERLLEKGRAGLYSKNQVEEVSPERLHRFFIEEDGGFRICKPIREMVVFAKHDVLSDPPFSRMDLLSCRNLLIYLEPPLQKRLLPTFHYALKPAGVLFLGSSETVGDAINLFAVEDKTHKIYSKKAGPSRGLTTPQAKPPLNDKRRGLVTPPPVAAVATELEGAREADRYLLGQYSPAAVLVDDGWRIIHLRGQTSPYLELPPGKVSLNLLKMLREGLLSPVRTSLQKAKKDNQTVTLRQVPLNFGQETRTVDLNVIPLRNVKHRCFLVVFEEAGDGQRGKRTTKEESPQSSEDMAEANQRIRRSGFVEGQASELQRLRAELAATKEYLQALSDQHEAANEELQAANEEGQSANEELQSINEELETTKEELESTNEELTTVNEEMGHRNIELHRINSDLNNVLAGVQMCIVVVGSDLSIKRFTPLAERYLNLVPGDVGRPITNIKPNFEFPALERKIREVTDQVQRTELEVQDKDGRWFSLRIVPYKTLDNRIDGAVLVLVDIDTLKRSEEEITRARDYAEATIRTARDPLVVLREDLHINTANQAFYNTFKLSPTEIEGRSFLELSGGAWNVPSLRQLLEEILPGGRSFDDFEVTSDFERLGRRTMLLNARPLEGSSGKLILLGIEDFTDRRQLEVLKESEERFRTLADAMPQLVWTCLPDGNCDYFNSKWTEYTGRPKDELIGMEWRELMNPADKDRTRQYWLEALKGHVPYDLEYRLQRADGEWHWFKVRATPLRDKEGNIIKWFGTSTDIEDQKQIQVQIEESQRWLRLIMESVKDFAIFTTDAKGTVTDWNPGAEHVFGYCGSEILGRDAGILFTPEDQARGVPQRELETARVSGCALDERWHLRKDGTRIFVSGAMRAIREESGDLRGFTKVARDITERKRHEQELQQAREDLEQKVAERTAKLRDTIGELEAFSYSISHDLRAPLRAMIGFTNMAIAEAQDQLNPTVKDYLARTITAANRLDQLIQDVLAYTRIVRADIRLAPVDLEALIRDVIQQYGYDTRAVDIEIQTPLLKVLGHQASLTQCVSNLFSNAIKFVSPGTKPHIKIWTEFRDPYVRLWFEDNGIGIDPADRNRIFGLFERVYSPREYEGTGIGLTIARKAVERMGGTMGVESEPGKGSRFWIQLKGL